MKKPWIYFIGLWLLVNIIILWPVDDTDREYYEAYLQTWQEIQEIRQQEFSKETWEKFAEEQRQILEPILDDLKETASPEEPTKQQLLWAGRDYLLPVLQKSSKIDPTSFQKHMDTARRHLRKSGFDVPSLEPPEQNQSTIDGN